MRFPTPKNSQLKGFTFAEVLAAMAFLAIVIPVIVEALTLSSRAGTMAERSSIAVELAQNQLDELSMNDGWAGAASTGDFGSDYPGFRYTLSQNSWTSDDMVELTLNVYFDVQGREHQISLTTLVSNTSSAL